jgi:hypothetical protein
MGIARLLITIHLAQQATVSFRGSQLWPGYAGSDPDIAVDLSSLTAEVARRVTVDGFVGFAAAEGKLTVIPAGAIRRVDVAVDPAATG